MSDDLLKRLDDWGNARRLEYLPSLGREAATRVRELEADLQKAWAMSPSNAWAWEERAERAEAELHFKACLVHDLLPYQERAVKAEAERESFYMDYRMKCDAETKEAHVRAKRAEAERDALRAEVERLRGALDRAARTLRGETGCEDQGQAYDTAQRIIDAALPDEPQDVDCNCPGFCTGKHNS